MLIQLAIVLGILIVLIIIFSLTCSNLPPYAHLTSDGFGGVPISQLAQPRAFYAAARAPTLKYLQAVYPAAKSSLAALNDLELASFYNSLWFYFNCKGRYTDNDLEPLRGTSETKWDALPCAAEIPLPYTPQGWLYNFYTYQKYNVPVIYSNSDPSTVYLAVENASSTRAGIMGSYQSRNARSSGIMWVMQRTIQRDVWYPNGLRNEKELQTGVPDNWHIKVGMANQFHFPVGWYGGLGNGQYIEVTHSPADTGDAINQSPWWWYNVSVGSGMFLQLGKTLAVKNKISGIFTMARMLAQNGEGRTLLQKWYNTTDPYQITWGIVGLCGYDMAAKQTYCDFGHQECGHACYPGQIGYSRAAGISLSSFYEEVLTLQGSRDAPNKDTIHRAIDLAVSNQHYALAHVAEHILADETNFFFGINLGLDTIQFYEDPNGNDNYVFEIIDLRIPLSSRARARDRDYSGFMNIVSPNARPIEVGNTWRDPNVAHQNRYRDDAIREYLENAYANNWISIRDPFDIYNNSKVLKCDGLKLNRPESVDLGQSRQPCAGNRTANSMYCDALYFMNQYKCLALGNEFNGGTCKLTGADITC